MRATVILIVIGALGTVLKGLEKRPEELEIKGIIEFIQAADRILKKVLGRKLAVTQTSMRDHQLMLE